VEYYIINYFFGSCYEELVLILLTFYRSESSFGKPQQGIYFDISYPKLVLMFFSARLTKFCLPVEVFWVVTPSEDLDFKHLPSESVKTREILPYCFRFSK
jgi:hypothetical protein